MSLLAFLVHSFTSFLHYYSYYLSFLSQYKVVKSLVSNMNRNQRFPEFDVENWVEVMGSDTFQTHMIYFSYEEAVAFIHLYQTKYLNRNSLNGSDSKTLLKLEKKINNAFFEKGFLKHHGAFVRLSTRSPKDGFITFLPKYRDIVIKDIQDCQNQATSDTNSALRRLFQITSSKLRVKDGSEAIALLSSSERIFQDLLKAQSVYVKENEILKTENEGKAIWNMNIILREFHPCVDGDYEFRGFVKGGVLTAVSQYNPYIALPEISQELEEEIRIALMEKYDSIKSKIKHADYIIDFAFLPKTKDVIIIELNPFDKITGSSLFSWETDFHLLHGLNNNDEWVKVELEGEEGDCEHEQEKRPKDYKEKTTVETVLKAVETKTIESTASSTTLAVTSTTTSSTTTTATVLKIQREILFHDFSPMVELLCDDYLKNIKEDVFWKEFLVSEN